MTAPDRETEAVMQVLRAHASAQRDIAKTLSIKAPQATELIATHQREGWLFELLHAQVAKGLLDRLEVRR